MTACGGSSTPTAPTAPPLPTVFTQTLTGSLGANTGNAHPLTIDRRGNLTLEVSWPGIADLDVYLTDPNCTDVFQQRTCMFYGQADSVSQNPERVTRTVDATQLRFNVWIVNASRVTSANYSLAIRVDYADTAPAALTGLLPLGSLPVATATGRRK